MRSSAVLSLVALTAVVPAFAAPVAPKPQFAKRQTTSQAKREPEESGAFAPFHFNGPPRFPFPGYRHGAVARTVDDFDLSGALSIPWRAIVKAAPDVIRAATAVYDIFKHKRDFEEVLTRELGDEFARELTVGDDLQSGALPWGKIIKWAPTVISAVSSFFHKRDIEELLARGDEHLAREFEEHLARELSAGDDLQSGAFPWATVAKWAPTVISAIGSFFNKRDVEELLARGDDHLARAFEEHLSRELSARDDLQSGAFPWATVAKWAPTVISAIGSFFNKRDVDELLARGDDHLAREFEEHLARELFARDDLESGAFPWATVARWAPVVIDAVSGLLRHKRDFEEFVVRSVLEARSLNELD